MCLSRADYAADTGLAILESLRRVRCSWWRPELVLIKAADLGQELRVRSDDEQELLSEDLAAMFPSAG